MPVAGSSQDLSSYCLQSAHTACRKGQRFSSIYALYLMFSCLSPLFLVATMGRLGKDSHSLSNNVVILSFFKGVALPKRIQVLCWNFNHPFHNPTGLWLPSEQNHRKKENSSIIFSEFQFTPSPKLCLFCTLSIAIR